MIDGKARCAALVLAVAVLAGEARAQTVEEFYRGRTLTLQIGSSPGGGYDVYARLFARYFGKYLPGQPRIMPQNVPGAGSLKLANDLYHVAPRDGSVIGAIGKEQVTAPLFGLSGARFDALKFNWLGTLDRTTSVCATLHTSRFHSLEQTREEEMVFGGTGPVSMTFIMPTALRELLGLRLKVVGGYPGSSELTIALERGEIDGRCGWSYATLVSTNADWFRTGKLRILAAVSASRIPALPDVPSVLEFTTTEEQRQVLSLILTAELMARPVLAPPGVPEDRLAALRKAFWDTVNDKDYIMQANKLGLEIDAADWRDMTDNIYKVYSTPAPLVSIVNRLITRGKL